MTCSATRRIFTVHEFSTLPRSQLIVLAGLDFSPLLSHPRPCPCSPVCPDAQLMPDASTSATFNEEIHRNTWREEPEATELSTSKLATCRLFPWAHSFPVTADLVMLWSWPAPSWWQLVEISNFFRYSACRSSNIAQPASSAWWGSNVFCQYLLKNTTWSYLVHAYIISGADDEAGFVQRLSEAGILPGDCRIDSYTGTLSC